MKYIKLNRVKQCWLVAITSGGFDYDIIISSNNTELLYGKFNKKGSECVCLNERARERARETCGGLYCLVDKDNPLTSNNMTKIN